MEATPPRRGAGGLLGRYIDLGRVGPLLQSFSDSAGVASAVIDLDGHVLTAAGWQPLCAEFHRRHPETLRRCIESDTSLAARMRVGDGAAVYTCLNGLTDAAASIIVDGRHLANAFVGQFLTAPPDIESFARRAERFGFDRESYLGALARVPVLSEEKACAALEFIASSAGMLADMGREGLMKEKVELRLRRTLERLRKSVDAAVGALAHTVEMRDPYTAGHQERVSELSVAIGRKLALRSRSITSLRIAGLIHDLGKIAVPAEILSKPGRSPSTSGGSCRSIRRPPSGSCARCAFPVRWHASCATTTSGSTAPAIRRASAARSCTSSRGSSPSPMSWRR
jgi:ligand-binding sensor protein